MSTVARACRAWPSLAAAQTQGLPRASLARLVRPGQAQPTWGWVGRASAQRTTLLVRLANASAGPAGLGGDEAAQRPPSQQRRQGRRSDSGRGAAAATPQQPHKKEGVVDSGEAVAVAGRPATAAAERAPRTAAAGGRGRQRGGRGRKKYLDGSPEAGELVAECRRVLEQEAGCSKAQADRVMAAAGHNPANLLRWVDILRGDGVGLAGPDLAASLAARLPGVWAGLVHDHLAAEAPLKLLWLQQELGLSPAQARGVVVRCPLFLLQPLEGQLQAVVAWLRQEAGLSRDQVAKVVKRQPAVLTRTVEGSLRPRLQWLLQEAGLNEQQACTAMARAPQLLTASIEGTLRPRLQWLHAQGISGAQAARFITAAPQVLCMPIPTLEAKLTAMGAALQASRQEVLDAWRKKSILALLDVTSPVMAPKVRFLTQVMGRSPREVLGCPAYLGCSLACGIGPRYCFTLLHGGQERAQRLALGTFVKTSESNFLHDLASHCHGGSLAEAVAASGCGSVQQLYAAYKEAWQAQPENREWVVAAPGRGPAGSRGGADEDEGRSHDYGDDDDREEGSPAG